MPMSRLTEAPSVEQADRDDVRAGMALANAMIHATSTRSTAYANRTLGQFIDALVSLGVRLDDPLGSIEFGIGQFGSGHIRVDRDEHGAIEVREVSR